MKRFRIHEVEINMMHKSFDLKNENHLFEEMNHLSEEVETIILLKKVNHLDAYISDPQILWLDRTNMLRFVGNAQVFSSLFWKCC